MNQILKSAGKLPVRSARPKASSRTADAARQLAGIKAFNNIMASRIELIPLESLRAHPRKTRVHNERLITTLMGSFNRFGFLVPLVIDENGVVIAGDARVEAARRLSVKALPCVRIDHLDDREKRAYKIADNRIAELAGWNFPELKIELDFLFEVDFNLDAIGFTTPEIDLVIGASSSEAAGQDKADDLPAPVTGPAVSRAGDLWLLGRHRVLCGSALDADALQVLMSGRLARMVLTDAPYNVEVNGFVSGLGKVRHREFAMASGEMSDDEFLSFLTGVTGNAAACLVEGGLFYGFIDWRGLVTCHRAMKACGLDQLNLCVWNKGTGGMGSLYRSQHEICLVFKKGRSPHINNVQLGSNGRYRTNVWDHPGMASFGKGRDESLSMHPTVKPVGLLVEAIRDVTQINDIVIDTFLGSGSTLIAAERCKRVCYGLEIDPLYVDTIIRRFETFAGQPAVHAATGKTFGDIASMRRQDRNDGADRSDNDGLHAGPVDGKGM